MKLNKNILVSFIVVIGSTFLFNYTFNKPTVINKYIATHIYSAPANSAFTDDNFYQCVVDNYNVENNASLAYTTELSDSQLATITNLSCSNRQIITLVGLDKLSNLTHFMISGNQLSDLNVSNNKELEYLWAYDNMLVSIDVNGLTKLNSLSVYNNQLTELNLNSNISLVDLSASSNKLTSLDLSSNLLLDNLSVFNNNLTTLNLDNITTLTNVNVANNELTTLNVKGNNNLEYLNAQENNLIDINIDETYSLTNLNVASNKLTNIDISNNNNILELSIHYNELTTLNIDNAPVLKSLNVQNNQLTDLNISNAPALTSLYVANNVLTNLDVTKNTNLEYLYLTNNQLKELDVSGLLLLKKLSIANNDLDILKLYDTPALTQIDATNNNLSNLDVSGAISLINLGVAENQLTSLDVSKNTKLTSLTAYRNGLLEINLDGAESLTTANLTDNNLLSVNVSNNSYLEKLSIYNNNLTSINIEGAISLKELRVYNNQLTSLDASKNSNLSIIEANNNELATINVNGALALTKLYLQDNQLTSLDISNNSLLTILKAQNNELTSANVNGADSIQEIYINDNQLTSLDISENTLLKRVDAHRNQLLNLDVSKNTNLEYLWVSENNLSNLRLGQNNLLETLYLYDNNINQLDLSGLTSLTTLDIATNQFEAINVSKNTDLTNLTVSENQLTELDLSNNLALKMINVGNNNISQLDLSYNSQLTNLYAIQNNLSELDLSNNLNLKVVNLAGNSLTALDVSKNTNLNNLAISDNAFSEKTAIYKNETLKLPSNVNSVKLIEGKNSFVSGVYNANGSNITTNYPVEVDSDDVIFKETNLYQLKVNYKHDIQTSGNYYSVYFDIYVIEATSDKYDINAEEGYIYTGTDTDTETILSNINLNYGEASIENNQLLIKYENELVKTFDIVNISSDTHDLTKEYIFNYNDGSINVNNGTMNKNTENNTIEIKYNDTIIDTYKLVEVSSEIYDLSGDSIGIKDNTINDFISNITCTNCEAKVYDGTNYLSEGNFGDNEYTLRIMYGEELLKEYALTFPVSGVALNKESIRLGLQNKTTYQLEATIIPAKAENKNVTWTSSDEEVAIVDDNGLVTSVGLGTATITATTEEGGYTATTEVEVVDIITYAINYIDGSNTHTEYYEEGEEVTIKSDITKEGYTLVGWEYNGTCYQLTDTLTMPAEDITLTAIYQANTYEVTYDYTNESFEVTYDSAYGELETPIKKGHAFKGWYLEDTLDTEVTEETIVKIANNHTLYAKWEINSYKLTIDPNGGLYNGEKELTINYNATTEINEPTRVGYEFKGWEITGEESIIDGTTFTMGISDTTLTAKWEIIIPNIEETSNYVIKNNMITNITLETSLEDFNLGLDSIYISKVIDKNNEEKTTGLIATGDKVQIYLDDTLVIEYIVSIKGDVSGDGKATVADFSKAYQFYKGRITMDDCYIQASDVVKNDSIITMADVSKIYQFIKKRISSLD